MRRRNICVLCGCLVLAALPFRAWGVCTITGDYTLNCGGVTYRAVDDECVHYVDLAAFNAAHPGTPLPDLKKTIAQNYAAVDTLQPVVVDLTDYVDCTGTSHNFSQANLCSSSPYPNQPSRLLTISGKQFRVTAAPTAGFATYYYSYDVATGGTAGVPHLLVAESSNDQERYTTLSLYHPDGIVIGGLPWAPPYAGEPTINPWGDPWWEQNPTRTQEGSVFGPDVGLATYTGRELPIDNLPFNIPMIFHPKTAIVRVVVSSLGCNASRQTTDGGAVSRMWIFKFVDAMSTRYPALLLPSDPGQERRIGIYMTHPWYFYTHYGTPVRLLSQRQAGLQRVMQDLSYCGFNYVVFNAINGSDRSGRAWYDGSTYFGWNSAGDLLSELPPAAADAGVWLVPLITSLIHPSYSGPITFTNDSYQLGTDGNFVTAFGDAGLDPLRPEVQQYTKNVLAEIATRVQASPAVVGLGIRANGKIGTCYIASQDGTRGARLAGYSSWDLQQYKNATGSAVPNPSPFNPSVDAAAAYNWLLARPNEWEAWINWRCQKTREFWLSCRDLIRSYRSDWNFYVQCDLPSETPGTNIEWASGQSPRNLLRHHGYDPNLFTSDGGIIISRGMMVAEDRFYVSTRWAAPWGSNYLNYSLFHYAPGLAELYQTASGRACEMYQNYWEENAFPYWEFGSCGDPNGFFGTQTPAAPGRAFFAGATMSVRRQDPGTMTWLGWNRPTLGHEADLRKFAQAFRALPVVTPVAVNALIQPAETGIVARWHGDRLLVINDTSSSQSIALQFLEAFPAGEELTDVVTGRKLLTAAQPDRQNLSFPAEAYSINVFKYTGTPPPPPPPPPPQPPVPGVDNPSFEDGGGTYNGWQIVLISGEGPDNPPLDNTNIFGPVTPAGTHFGGKITNWLSMNFYLGQVVGASAWYPTGTDWTWQLSALVQLRGTDNNPPYAIPGNVHQVWDIGWMNDGSEPGDVMGCDHYQTIASIDANYTGNSQTTFFPLSLSGTLTGVTGLRGVAVRVHFYNDSAREWSYSNIDNLSFTITPPPVPGDLNGDGHVNGADFDLFQNCATGPNLGPPPAGCTAADLDADDDVDQSDFGILQRCYTGSTIYGDPSCAN